VHEVLLIRRALCCVLLVAITCLLPPDRVAAEPDAPQCGQQLDEAHVEERLAWLDARLSKGVGGAVAWWGGWLSYATGEGAVGWTKFARATDRLERDLWLVTGVGAALWVAQLAAFSMPAAYAPLRVRRQPRATAAQRRLALAASERLLHDAAQAERGALHWSEHVLDLAWAVGSAAYVLGRSYGHVPTDRLLAATGVDLGVTVLLSEAAILSTPRQAIRDQQRYGAWSCEKSVLHGERWATSPKPVWHVRLDLAGASLSVRF
jgi:hypothetical protein